MSWFFIMKDKYAPGMTPLEFSDFVNEIETVLFNEHPEYLELPEEDQNNYVEACIKRNIQ